MHTLHDFSVTLICWAGGWHPFLPFPYVLLKLWNEVRYADVQKKRATRARLRVLHERPGQMSTRWNKTDVVHVELFGRICVTPIPNLVPGPNKANGVKLCTATTDSNAD